jgi:uncharacterized OB-fold protein
VVDVVRDDASAEFFDGAARGDLMIKRCDACGHHLRPDSVACSQCRGSQLSWTESSGRGSLVSWIVVHADEAATTVGLVELEEGPWLHGRLVDIDGAALSVGQAVEVEFEPAGPESIPVFRPA